MPLGWLLPIYIYIPIYCASIYPFIIASQFILSLLLNLSFHCVSTLKAVASGEVTMDALLGSQRISIQDGRVIVSNNKVMGCTFLNRILHLRMLWDLTPAGLKLAYM
jgi:hypothetical protein